MERYLGMEGVAFKSLGRVDARPGGAYCTGDTGENTSGICWKP
jgi:hypothetical protein